MDTKQVLADLDEEIGYLLEDGLPMRAEMLIQTRAAVAQLAEDAERYRWLRKYAESIDGAGISWFTGNEPLRDNNLNFGVANPSLDAAIDAAIERR